VGKAFLAHLTIKPDKAFKNQEISHNTPLKDFFEAAFLPPDQVELRAFGSEKGKQMINAVGMGHETESSVELKL